VEVIVKFFPGQQEGVLIAKTLGKVAMIARNRRGAGYPQPKAEEFWRCRILKEVQEGKPSGCFLLEPVARVQEPDVLRLLPGMYTSSVQVGRMLVTPNPEYRGRPAILPLDHKHAFSARDHAYCLLVDVTPPPPKTSPYAR
jgi:hypothetical protein